jgi:hypothetical protein
MPIRSHVDPVHGRIVTRAEGLVTLAAHIAAEERAGTIGPPELLDTRADSTDLTAPQVRELVPRVHELARHGRIGPTAVVATNAVVYGMARMSAILGEEIGIAVEVVRDLPSAEAWLDRFDRPGGPGRP